jgi:mRNA interferase HigB
MRIIARSTIAAFSAAHPDAAKSLRHWLEITKHATWASTDDVRSSFSKAKVLNAERVRFEISGGDYRLIAAFDFRRGIVFIKFIGTHADYDRVDALTVSLH